MEKDFNLLLHSFGYQNAGKLIPRSIIFMHLEYYGVNLNDTDMKQAVWRAINEAYEQLDNEPDAKYLFKSEAYYRHLDYMELQQAMKNSHDAQATAIAALLLAIVVGILQIYTQVVTSR